MISLATGVLDMADVLKDQNYYRMLSNGELIERAKQSDNDLAKLLAERLENTEYGTDYRDWESN